MFFPRLRRRAKWVFAFLAAAFALSVVFFGVGTGISGANPWDAIQEWFQERESGSADLAEARQRAEQSPQDAEVQLAYATALAREGRTREAITALERYTAARPRDAEALRTLAGLWGRLAAEARNEADAASAEAQQASLEQLLAPESELLQPVAQNRIAESLATLANERADAARERATSAARNEAAVYQQLTLLEPNEPSLWLQLGTASQSAQDYEAAIAAYERFLELAPDDSSAPLVRQQLELLKQVTTATSG
jgi:regulator of sirC expression with transglutaminase-like and TPR domain